MTNDILAKYSDPLPKNALQSAVNFGIIPTQSQKTTAEPQNSNYLSLAHSTPQACFFMRGLHTPKERLESLELQERLSMVACNGKGFALCCVPVIAVSEPVTRYRPKPQNFQAVTLEKSFTGVTQMYQFIFAAIRRTDLTNHIQKIRINADSEQQARAILAREFVLILAGKINLKNDRTFSPEQNHSLQSSVMMGSICGTISRNANRKRYSSGIFLPQIHLSTGEHRPRSTKFAVRLISRNKPRNRTNKVSSFRGVVETVSHLILSGTNHFLTKHGNPTIKTSAPKRKHRPNCIYCIHFQPCGGGLCITLFILP
ncbi:hypothetical protein BKK51_12395 [Rodentibacter trehalosifermentans]|uniref:Ash family protein n=1 Tax=Rodentibacter trehalosifermentans TaxID=1908263 RepID=A0A1V3ILM6_9PAST|nr:host cell division inhibitor Icd-like protein [Rodentibacter trehalosifermentans]OOF42844.1 hypothetical protein BKK51_12395 [Rodentibacter trehalosifermentans]